jgi:hypothetical protein
MVTPIISRVLQTAGVSFLLLYAGLGSPKNGNGFSSQTSVKEVHKTGPALHEKNVHLIGLYWAQETLYTLSLLQCTYILLVPSFTDSKIHFQNDVW